MFIIFQHVYNFQQNQYLKEILIPVKMLLSRQKKFGRQGAVRFIQDVYGLQNVLFLWGLAIL